MKKIKVFCLICICFFIFTGCSVNERSEMTIKDKTKEEINYIENKLLLVLNRYAKKEYGNDGEYNWDAINEDILGLNNQLDTMILDFYELEITNDEIIDFRDSVNKLLISAANEDISLVLTYLNDLYSKLPNYYAKSDIDRNKVMQFELKSLIVSSFTKAELLEWEESKRLIDEAENKYKGMMDDIDYMKEYKYNLNKIYILIGEVKNAIYSEEINLTRMKYINFIEKI